MGSIAAALVVLMAMLVAACGDSGQSSSATAARSRGAFVSDGPRRTAIVWAAGDGADGGPGAAAVTRLVERARPDRFLYLGDVYEYGTAADFRAGYGPLYGSLAGITEPTPGNHEWANRFSGYYDYWRAKKGRSQPPWSKVGIAGWELLNLNSEAAHGRGSRQLRWLGRALAAGGDCRIAFWHRPRFSAGKHGDAPDLQPLWRAVRGRVRLVLNGHDHDLQRLRRLHGTTILVAGAGGHSRYALHRDYPRLVWGSDSVDGALRLRLRPGRLRFAFISVDGRILDRGRARCR
jgi:hypothetical protein